MRISPWISTFSTFSLHGETLGHVSGHVGMCHVDIQKMKKKGLGKLLCLGTKNLKIRSKLRELWPWQSKFSKLLNAYISTGQNTPTLVRITPWAWQYQGHEKEKSNLWGFKDHPNFVGMVKGGFEVCYCILPAISQILTEKRCKVFSCKDAALPVQMSCLSVCPSITKLKF